MDCFAHAPYVRARMNLLLLLSALLSALTGIGGSVRSPDVAQAVAGQSVAVAATTVRRMMTTHRPANAAPRATRIATIVTTWALSPVQAIWAGRRRE
jgi:hypothetical protein